MATTELEPVQRPESGARSEGLEPETSARHGIDVGRLREWVALHPDAVAIAVLLGCTVTVYWPTVVGLAIYARADSFTFFYPVFAALHDSLRAGELPLWTPYVFGGFPLFAEGQIGALYPPSLLAALLPSPVDGFLQLRVFHVVVAVIGTYAFARTIGAEPLGSCVAGLVFGFGSFVVAQQHHASMLAAAVWLPPLLVCVERALRNAAWASHGYLAAAAALLALQTLASHPQMVIFSGAMLIAYILARQWGRVSEIRAADGTPAERRRAVRLQVLLGLWAAVLVPILGAMLAAIQLVPLYELSRESWRAHGWTYQDATEYSFPPINFLTLVFPYFFRGPDGGQWSLWQIWEVELYVGVVPLLLAVLGVVFVRRWPVTLFRIVVGVSAFLALGGYTPFGLHQLFWNLPGIALQRAPARFTMLTVLGLAILAAFGADWLAERHPRRAVRRHARMGSLLHVGVLLLVAVLAIQLVTWRAWLQADQSEALRALTEWYLRLPHDPLQALSPLKVYAGLNGALDLANPKTAMPLLLLGAFALLLLGWRELPRLGAVWRGALIALVAFDLVVFAIDFHPLVAAEHLPNLGGPGEFLAANARGTRAMIEPDVEDTRPNQMLPVRVAEVAGYSPLELERHRWYASVVGTVDNTLLDLWGVGYVVKPAAPPSLPSYDQVGFHPRRPLMIGGSSTPNGRLALSIPNDTATELRMVAALTDGLQIADGAVIGEWVLTDPQGVRRVLPIRAGREVADWAIGDVGVRTAHRPVQVAATVPIREPSDGLDRNRKLSYAALALPSRQQVARAEYRHVHPLGRSTLYGVALVDRPTDTVGQFYLQEKYRPAYRDADAAVYENRAAFPRAFVVPEAIQAADGPASLELLMHGPFDPTRQVVIEGSGSERPGEGTGRGASGGVSGAVTLVQDGSRLVNLRAVTPAGGHLVLSDPHYPGWRAYVDGFEVELLRANYLFRAVALPPGEHDVAFVFDPPSIRLGAALSAAGLGLFTALVVVARLGPPIANRLRSRPMLRRPRWPAFLDGRGRAEP